MHSTVDSLIVKLNFIKLSAIVHPQKLIGKGNKKPALETLTIGGDLLLEPLYGEYP